MLRDYELVMLVSPQVADDEVDNVVQRVAKFVSDHGGQVSFVKPWGRRRLAYHIGDFEEASYVQANFKLDAKGTHDLVNNLNISEEIIRHLLVKDES